MDGMLSKMEISTVISLVLTIFHITLSEAGDCSDKPAGLELMKPETCYFGPGVIDYDTMIECEIYLVSKIDSEAHEPNGKLCTIDCMLKADDVLKDMKLDAQRYIEGVKNRTTIDYDDWKSAVDKAVEECFPKAEEKLATLNAADFDETKKCNPIPKKLLTCVNAMVLVNAPNTSRSIELMNCRELKDFYMTCDFVF